MLQVTTNAQQNHQILRIISIIIAYYFNSNMRLNTLLVLLLLLIVIHPEALQLFSVSNSATHIQNPSGSLKGGTTIYIRGVGFSTNAADNQVYIGNFPCDIPADGATQTSLACVTTTSNRGSGNLNVLPITVVSSGVQQTLSNGQGFSYRYEHTPVIHNIFPKFAVPGSYIRFYGEHRVTYLGDGRRDMGEVISMFIGNTQCGRFDINQGLAANSMGTISCRQAQLQEAGKYNVQEHLNPGYSSDAFFFRRTSLLNQYYHFAVLPKVDSISPNVGTYSGQRITIAGGGFSTNASVLKVDVNGTTCDIVNSTLSQIICDVRKKDVNEHSILNTNAGTQNNGYYSGKGLRYRSYGISNLGDKSPNGLRNAINSGSNSIQLYVDGYKGQIETPPYYGGYYGQAFTGYFTPPVDGQYTFQGVSGDSFNLYLSTIYGSANRASSPLIFSNSPQQSNFYLSYVGTAQKNITLKGGKSYYIEVYHINRPAPGFLRVNVQVPNKDTSLLWQTHTAQRLNLWFTNDPQIMQFNQTGAVAGRINLTIVTRTQGKPPTVEYTVFNYDASISSFLAAIKKFQCFANYGISGRRQLYDQNDTLTNNIADAYTYSWIISIPILRPKSASETIFTPVFLDDYNGTDIFTYAVIHPHGPLINGYFKLSLGGYPIKKSGSNSLHPGIAVGDLQGSFRSFLPGFGHVDVNIISDPFWQAYGANWVITYYAVNQWLPDLVVEYSGLWGGKAGTFPKMSTSTMRYYSSDLLFDPIDYTMLHTFDSQANVLVTVNNLTSVCTGNCRFNFLPDTPVVLGAQLSGSVLTMNLNDPVNLNYTLTDVTITLAGQSCTIVDTSAPIGNFQCQLPMNTDSTPTIPAGSYLPQVTITQIGLLAPVSTLLPLNFPLTLTSISLPSGGDNGGYTLTLTGQGFPLNKIETKVRICNVDATIRTLSNINADVIVPRCTIGAQNVTISSLNHSSSQLPFSYFMSPSPGYIYSISPNSHNPAVKGIMNISGMGFGDNQTAIRVDLSNSSGKVYPLRILKINDTYIKVGLPGGMTGFYKVQVNKIGIGEILPNNTSDNQFSYEMVIYSVTPSSGSVYGGTLLNIKGTNFAPAFDQTLIYIGNQLNWWCVAQFINTTDIFCRTPNASQYYNISKPQTVYVQVRLMVENTCYPWNSCQFNYLSPSLSPQLTAISTSSIVSGEVVLSGQNLNSSKVTVVLFNKQSQKITVVTPTSFNQSTVTFNVPIIESGQYKIKVRVQPVGQTDGKTLNINAAFTGKSVTSMSTNGGVVTLYGRGLPASWPHKKYIIKITEGNAFLQPKILSAQPDQLIIALPQTQDAVTFTVSMTTPMGGRISTSMTARTSFTPTLTLASSSLNTPGINTLNFTKNNLKAADPNYVQVYSIHNPTQIYNITLPGPYTDSIQFSCQLPGGLFGFRFNYPQYGYATCINTLPINITKPVIPTIQSSYNGGTFSISGTGLSPSGTLSFQGFKTTLTNVTATSAVGTIPPAVNQLTQTKFQLSLPSTIKRSQFTIISDSSAHNQKAFDAVHGSSYYSSQSPCYIGFDVGSGLLLNLTRLRIFPYNHWLVVSDYLNGAKIEASNDGTTYDVLATIDSTVHTGWNIFPFNLTTFYRYFRIIHNTVSNCRIAQIQIQGVLLSKNNMVSLGSNLIDAIYEDGTNTFNLLAAVQLREDTTPIVTSLSQPNGDVFGGYNLTLNGNYLNFSIPIVQIDGKICQILTYTQFQIICNVSSRYQLPSKNSFTVTVGGNNAVIEQKFEYVMRWSDIRTWGTDMPPIDGDIIFVPPGMHLLVDQTTPQVAGIFVQNGTISFADEIEMVVHSGFIIMIGGRFLAGTEKKPYMNKLTFVMYGGYYGAQAPIFGNKGIGCLECFLSMHGEVRQLTWSQLSTTINPSTSTFELIDPVDWRVGEQIVVASTSFNHNEAEKRIITAINNGTFTVDRPFRHQHFSGVQQYGSGQLVMRAEVGLLTRNIKMMGDSTSVRERYGSHLLLAGSAQNGLVGHIAYSQFTDCGQPRIIGRYCIHFHMNGDVHQSFARGNAVHESMARVITLHGVHFLTVQYNVGYRVSGHNFFIEDGIQTHNLLQYNLAISSLEAWTMLQTDISVASFWVTNPSNTFRYNHAAGSDFYGFWYQIKPTPNGPSATGDVCPMGNPLGQTHHNVAHSNRRFGLRIFKLAPRKYPCRGLSIRHEETPWITNQPVIGVFSDFTLYKNGECGLLAEQTGNLIFKNFVTAENSRAGAQFYVSEWTEKPIQIRDSVIIGRSRGNSQSSGHGIITPQLGDIRIDNISFHNFPGGSHSIQTCSGCSSPNSFTNTGMSIFISNITYSNISGMKLYMAGVKREVLYDLDGSFTKTDFDGIQRNASTVTFNYPHLRVDPACNPTTNSGQWHNTLACDDSVKLVMVSLKNMAPSASYDKAPMRIAQIPDVYYNTSTIWTTVYSVYPGADKDSKHDPKTYAVPYITGKMYGIQWRDGYDFTDLQMTSSQYLTESDDGVLLRMRYTQHREAFDVGSDKPSKPMSWSEYFFPTPYPLDSANCTNGEYFHDDALFQRTFQLCASGRNKTRFFTTVVAKAIPCRYLCPQPPGPFIKQDFVRYWSNASQWPDQRLPLPGEDVYVNGNWTIVMDMDPAPCGMMDIDGDVIIEDKEDRNVTCDYIWIKVGSITAGQPSQPFMHQLTFQLNGAKKSQAFTFDIALQNNKIMVVTGQLNLYGYSPDTIITKLLQSAYPGDTQLTVSDATGWQVNDTIVISPSFSSPTQYQKLDIVGINGNVITFDPPLRHTHYGAPSVTITRNIGQLDMRATVGHTSRTIKFVSGWNDPDWGYTIWVYQMWQGFDSKTGNAILDSVQFQSGGQRLTQNAILNLFNNGDNSRGTTIVKKSSFSNRKNYCIYAQGHRGGVIEKNVFYEGAKFHIKLERAKAFSVNSNLLIGARTTGRGPVACIEITMTAASFTVTVNHNICQGSDINGFVLPLAYCGQFNNMPYKNNTVGSAAANGFLLSQSGGGGCMGFTGIKAYACGVGMVANPAGIGSLKYTKLILADNRLALSLRFGGQGRDRSAFLQNSYITAVSRPNCPECYAGKTHCSGIQAVRLLAVTINGEHYPGVFHHFDGLCKNEALDAKAFIKNVIFQNYRTHYNEAALAACGGNFLFKPNDNAPDHVGSTYVWDTYCNNCDFNALARFDQPKRSELGWFGGCGTIVCTGKQNYLIQDYTGHLFNKTGVLLASNRQIGDNTPECTYHPYLNGHFCTIHQFAVMEYESIAPDRSTRIMWPVSLKYDGGSWQTFTNGFKEWDWAGGEPMNRRLGRFISTVRLFQYYNMTYASNPPDDLILQLQKRTPGGNSSDWIVIRLYYPFPNMIEVQANGHVVRPISLLQLNGTAPTDTKICGSNKFYYFNRTIQFVLTGNCAMRISLTNSVQLTLHFAMQIADFFKRDGKTRMIDRMFALFNIKDQSRVKIVSVYPGSTKVTLMINAPVIPQNKSETANHVEGLRIAKQLKKDIDANINLLGSQLMSQDGIGPLISAESTLIPLRPEDDTTSSQQDSSLALMIIIIASAAALAITVAVVVIVYLRRRPNKVRDLMPTVSEQTFVETVSRRKCHPSEQITESNLEEITEEVGDSANIN